jgi:hypothetical protein
LFKVKNWLQALSYYALPLIEFSTRKIEAKVAKGDINANVKDDIISWKATFGIQNSDELEYKYFLQGVGIIEGRPISNEDMEIPLGNICLKDLCPSKQAKVFYLTKVGTELVEFDNNQQYHLFESFLFWLLLRSKAFNPLLQKLLSDSRCYNISINEEIIPSKDAMSRMIVKRWLGFFGLINGGRIDRSKLSILLLFSTVMELNDCISKSTIKELVENLTKNLSEAFSLNRSVVDFSVFLDYIFSAVDRSIMTGYPSGREHGGLPSRPSVQILEIDKPIPFSVMKKPEASGVIKSLLLGGVA